MSNTPQLLLAARPGFPGHSGCPIACMGFRVGAGPCLLRLGSCGNVQGGLLYFAGDNRTMQGDPTLFCRQVLTVCRSGRMLGAVADLEQPPDAGALRLLQVLESTLYRSGLALWVPECCGSALHRANILLPTALSGGTLRRRCEDAIQTCGVERITLAVSRMAADFILPAPDGGSAALSQQQVQQLIERHRTAVHFSPELCVNYFTYPDGQQVHLVLFDDGTSIHQKLLLAGTLGIPYAMAAWDEVSDCMEQL